jgi:hypothetical protein
MSLKRECDRCHHLTPVDSVSGCQFRVVQISRGVTASTSGGATTIYKLYDLCENCVLSLEHWLETHQVEKKGTTAWTTA